MNRVALALACEALQIEKLCDQDYLFLQEFVIIIKPIANAITYLEGNVQTFGGYLPMLFSVRQTLKDLYINDDLVFCKSLLLAVRDGFDKRFAHLMRLSTVFDKADAKAVPLFIAMLTNPEFKMNFIPIDWFHSNADGMNQIKLLLLNVMKQYLEEEKQQQQQNETEKVNNSSPDDRTHANENPFEQGMSIRSKSSLIRSLK